MFEDAPGINPDEVAGRRADGWTLLDVRSDEEWADAHIDGAVHIPMDQIMERMGEVDEQVICVCAVGARSARVTQFLNAQGKDAVNLLGGVYGWADAGLPLTR